MDNQNQPRIFRLFGYLRPHWKLAATIVTLTLLTSSLNSIEPMVQKVLIDTLSGVHSTWLPDHLSTLQILGSIVGVLLGFALMRGVLQGFSNYLSWRLQLYSKLTLLQRAVGNIFGLSLSQHQSESHGVGAVMTRLDRGINGLSWAFFDIALTLLPSLLYLVWTVVFMLSMDVRLTFIALAFAPLPALLGLWGGRVYAMREQMAMDKWIAIYARFNEGLSLIKLVKAFVIEDAELTRFIVGVEAANKLTAKQIQIDQRFQFVKNVTMDLGKLTITGYGAYLCMTGHITIGAFVAFISYTNNLFGPVMGLAGMYETFRKTKVYLDVLFDVIDTPDSVKDLPTARELEKVSGAVEFDAVTFGYRKDKPPTLKNISFKVEPGQMVAFVGPSGAGKTTIIDMVCRFFDPWSGRVFFDDVDIRDVKQKSVRKLIGMVPQDTSLFNDTIKNNIKIGRPQATDEEVYAAAKAAGAHLFIERKPDRYDTIVGEKGNLLSGGERQRVAIARAMITNPPIYIMDEASAALDAESEELVHKSMNDLRTQKKTLFVIAHRLSTVRDADQIIVLRSGEVVEQGTHEELIKKGGLYHKLVTVQQLSTTAEVSLEAEVKRPAALAAVKSGETVAVELPPPPPAGPTIQAPAPAAVALGPSAPQLAPSVPIPAEPQSEGK